MSAAQSFQGPNIRSVIHICGANRMFSSVPAGRQNGELISNISHQYTLEEAEKEGRETNRANNTHGIPEMTPSCNVSDGEPKGVSTILSTTFSKIFGSSKPEPPIIPICTVE